MAAGSRADAAMCCRVRLQEVAPWLQVAANDHNCFMWVLSCLPYLCPAQVERIPEPVQAGITARILPALAYMHSHRMVHRDIKVGTEDKQLRAPDAMRRSRRCPTLVSSPADEPIKAATVSKVDTNASDHSAAAQCSQTPQWLQPANILMSTDGQPKVSDFGISAFMDNTIAQVGGLCVWPREGGLASLVYNDACFG